MFYCMSDLIDLIKGEDFQVESEPSFFFYQTSSSVGLPVASDNIRNFQLI